VGKRKSAERYFKKRWKSQPPESVSDFGAYCVEEWLTGRNISTHYFYLGVDYLRSHGVKLGGRGGKDAMQTPRRISYESVDLAEKRLGADSYDLKRFQYSHALRSSELTRKERITLILYYQYGFTLKEIGDLFDLTGDSMGRYKESGEKKILQTERETGGKK